MPELIRSVVSRMRIYVRDRRQSPRLRVRLLFTVSMRRKSNGDGSGQRVRLMKGHTRDISTNGLALNVPQVHLDGYHLAAEGRELELTLELPGNPISMRVVSRRYERLEEAELGCNYLIGARIVWIDDQDRARYMTFINEGLERQ